MRHGHGGLLRFKQRRSAVEHGHMRRDAADASALSSVLNESNRVAAASLAEYCTDKLPEEKCIAKKKWCTRFTTRDADGHPVYASSRANCRRTCGLCKGDLEDWAPAGNVFDELPRGLIAYGGG
mmetsp:Transcript_23219/g.57335  ORF Transcript_23219/g.57335 Transcript_23219/m.57335 type:complete len:124 (-) Transcript_23219:10-381(-)